MRGKPLLICLETAGTQFDSKDARKRKVLSEKNKEPERTSAPPSRADLSDADTWAAKIPARAA
jgi:hypothetical protein